MEDPAEEAASTIFPQIFAPIGGFVGSLVVARLPADCSGGPLEGTIRQCENPFGVNPIDYAIFLASDFAQIAAASVVAFIAWIITAVAIAHSRSS
jgi:hypothetical protein